MEQSHLFEGMDAQTRVLRHGGREVLRLFADLPAGETAAARHTRAMVKALCGYAEGEPKRAAAAQLEEAVRAGKGYVFVPLCCRITVKTRPVRRLFCVEIAFALTRGGEVLQRRALDAYWNADGAWQRRPLFRRLRRRA